MESLYIINDTSHNTNLCGHFFSQLHTVVCNNVSCTQVTHLSQQPCSYMLTGQSVFYTPIVLLLARKYSRTNKSGRVCVYRILKLVTPCKVNVAF